MSTQTKQVSGPWELDSAKDADGRYFVIHGQLPKGINGDFGYPVADTMNRHHCIAPDEDEANARLIVAAPELLEALEEMVGHQPLTAFDVEFRRAIMDKAERAIAKAKGESFSSAIRS